jgi:hypothetical protein
LKKLLVLQDILSAAVKYLSLVVNKVLSGSDHVISHPFYGSLFDLRFFDHILLREEMNNEVNVNAYILIVLDRLTVLEVEFVE